MDKLTLGLIALRAAALAAAMAGRVDLSNQLYKLGDFLSAGLVSDEHMKEVAEKLNARNSVDADFSDVLSRIEANRATLHAGS